MCISIVTTMALSPLIEWFDELEAKALDKCRVAIELLREHGHELRRPQADYLRDGIYGATCAPQAT